jgi:hypothetical protein
MLGFELNKRNKPEMKVCPNLKSEQSFQSDPCPAFLEVDYKEANQHPWN